MRDDLQLRAPRGLGGSSRVLEALVSCLASAALGGIEPAAGRSWFGDDGCRFVVIRDAHQLGSSGVSAGRRPWMPVLYRDRRGAIPGAEVET